MGGAGIGEVDSSLGRISICCEVVIGPGEDVINSAVVKGEVVIALIRDWAAGAGAGAPIPAFGV